MFPSSIYTSLLNGRYLILTSDKYDLSKEENAFRRKEFLKEIKRLGFKIAHQVVGCYKGVTEQSYCIGFGDLTYRDKLSSLAIYKWGQECVLYLNYGEGSLIYADKKIAVGNLQEIHRDQTRQFDNYSIIKGKYFIVR